MASRVLRLYTDDELVARARYLRDQIDSGLTSVADGLGTTSSFISTAAARRIVNELMDELDRRAGVRPPGAGLRITNVIPVSGYGYGRRTGRPFE